MADPRYGDGKVGFADQDPGLPQRAHVIECEKVATGGSSPGLEADLIDLHKEGAIVHHIAGAEFGQECLPFFLGDVRLFAVSLDLEPVAGVGEVHRAAEGVGIQVQLPVAVRAQIHLKARGYQALFQVQQGGCRTAAVSRFSAPSAFLRQANSPGGQRESRLPAEFPLDLPPAGWGQESRRLGGSGTGRGDASL